MANRKVSLEAAEGSRHAVFTEARTWKIFTYSVLVLGAVVSLVPFLWMIMKSLMSLGESLGSSVIPSEIHLENYTTAWTEAKFSHYMLNSVKITGLTLVGELVFSIMAA